MECRRGMCAVRQAKELVAWLDEPKDRRADPHGGVPTAGASRQPWRLAAMDGQARAARANFGLVAACMSFAVDE